MGLADFLGRASVCLSVVFIKLKSTSHQISKDFSFKADTWNGSESERTVEEVV